MKAVTAAEAPWAVWPSAASSASSAGRWAWAVAGGVIGEFAGKIGGRVIPKADLEKLSEHSLNIGFHVHLQKGVEADRAGCDRSDGQDRARGKNMKPVACQEDIVMAVEAARTAWALTDINRIYSRDIARRRPIGRTGPGPASIALLTMYSCLRSLARRSRMSGRC